MEGKIGFFDYPLQFREHKAEYMRIIEDVLSRGAYILGEDVDEFEKNLAGFSGSNYAIGVGNCTDAILLSLYAAGVGPGDEVISVSHTFVATIEVIKFLGAKPVLVDVADDHNMNIGLVENAINSKTKAIIPVHLNGRICHDMDRLVSIAEKHKLIIIEDAAQSLGATYKGKGAGTFGLCGCFSFYPAKLLGTFGDAGGIVTDDAWFAEKVRMLRNHGKGAGTEISMWGLNCRLDNLHAAILNYRISLLPEWIRRRREIAGIYQDGLSDIKEVKLPPSPVEHDNYFDVFQNYEIEVERRDDLVQALGQNGIEAVLPWGGKGVHQFKALGLTDFNLPRTEQLFKDALMLPLHPGLTDKQAKYIVEAIRNFYK